MLDKSEIFVYNIGVDDRWSLCIQYVKQCTARKHCLTALGVRSRACSLLNFTLCLKEDTDSLGNIISDTYVVRSLRVEDSVPRCSDAYEVQYIFAKRNDEKLHSSLKYIDERYEISNLLEKILGKLDYSLLNEY